MCMTNEAAAIKLAERDNRVGELVHVAELVLEATEARRLKDWQMCNIYLSEAAEKATAAIAKAREGAQS